MGYLSPKLPWELAQTKWSSIINPVLAIPFLAGNQIDSIVLIATTPKTINHKLARMPQGWVLTDNTANAVVWRPSPYNDFSIVLESSANTTISIWVY